MLTPDTRHFEKALEEMEHPSQFLLAIGATLAWHSDGIEEYRIGEMRIIFNYSNTPEEHWHVFHTPAEEE